MSVTTLIDTNVLVDLTHPDSPNYDWAVERYTALIDQGGGAINPIIYAEFAGAFDDAIELDKALIDVVRLPLPYESGFLVSRAFLKYRKAGGQKRSPLPDFFIGAHAAVSGLRLLTANPSDYRGRFPQVELIAPPQT